jgi:hypothetical protein
MRRLMFVAAACAFLAGPAMASLSWNYNYAAGNGNTLTSPYGAVVDTFDLGGESSGPGGSVVPTWTYAGNYAIDLGDVPGTASAPYNGRVLPYGKDNTHYFSVPASGSAAGVATVDFGGGSYRYLGLFWGSMDAYNQIEFLSGGVGGSVVGTITGTDVAFGNDPDGGQTSVFTNEYVNIFSTVDFDAIRITSFAGFGGSSPYAFELDNLAVAVPVPGAFLLALFGLGAGLKLRRFV